MYFKREHFFFTFKKTEKQIPPLWADSLKE